MLTHNGVASPKKEGNIQICMLNCQNKVMSAYVIIKNPKNIELVCGSNTFSYSLIT